MLRDWVISIAILAVLLSSCSKSKDVAAAAPTGPQTLTVSAATASTRTVPAAFSETGSFIADESSDIAPMVAGRVIATPVNVGDFVRQGQVICELDHRDAQLRLDQAKAVLDQATAALRQSQSRIGFSGQGKFQPENMPEAVAARAAFESAMAQAKLAAADAKRYENLVASGDVSRAAFERASTAQETADAQANAARQQYEAALNGARQSYGAVENSQASLEGARSQLAQAEKALADTTIRAPFDGSVTARPVAAGEYVALTNKIATIVRTGTEKLQLQTPEQRAAQGKLGMTVLARVSAYPDREFTGKITAVNQSVDPNSRIFILEAKFDNPKGELRPGMFATARVLLPGGEKAVFSAACGRHPRQDYGLLPGLRDRQQDCTAARGGYGRCGRQRCPHSERPDRRRNGGDEPAERVVRWRSGRGPLDHAYTRAIVCPSARIRHHAGDVAGGGWNFLLLRPGRGFVPEGRYSLPCVVVIIANPGASPEEIETEISKKVDDAVNTISQVDEVRSVSSEGQSLVTITFELSKNGDVAAQEVQNKVNLVVPNLPQTAKQPVVQKFDPDATPILQIAVSAKRSLRDVTLIADKQIKQKLENASGVGQITIVGGARREIHVQVDPDKLRSYNLTINDVFNALRSQNLELPGGNLNAGARDLTVRTTGRIVDSTQFNQITVATRNGYVGEGRRYRLCRG